MAIALQFKVGVDNIARPCLEININELKLG